MEVQNYTSTFLKYVCIRRFYNLGNLQDDSAVLIVLKY
jgi:hypothetical protein